MERFLSEDRGGEGGEREGAEGRYGARDKVERGNWATRILNFISHSHLSMSNSLSALLTDQSVSFII